MIVFSIISTLFVYLNHQKSYKEEINRVKKEFIQKNRDEVFNNVTAIYKYIENKEKLTQKRLKESLKDRVYEAHKIAMHIYEENRGKKSDDEIKKMIKDALVTIRFNDNRGYFFIYSFDYECILLPIARSLEGSNFYNFKEGRGEYLTRNIIDMVKKEEEGFLAWWYHKPDDMKKNYKKIGFNKHFKPYNWFIGTGEYVKDYEKIVKKEILSDLKSIGFQKSDEYIFIVDEDGKILSYYDESMLGKNFKESRIIDEKSFSLVNNLPKEGDFITYYHNYKPHNRGSFEKVSYVKSFEPWSWLIGQGFYTADANVEIEKERKHLEEEFKDYLIQIFTISLTLTIFLLILSFYLSKILQDKFKMYRDDIDFHIKNNQKQTTLLAQQSKMAAMGDMLGNIAHQWRQPLSIISTAASGISLQKEMGILKDAYLDDAVKHILNSSKFLSTTIDDFRDFFKLDKQKVEVTLPKIIEKAINLVDAKFKNSEIEIVVDLVDCKLYILENEFIQVIINILNNAKDKLMESKDIDKIIFIESKVEDNRVILEIKDSGGGIDEKIMHRVFEPYFTTKHQFSGTGIGLYMTREIITKHMGGEIEVENSSFICNKIEYKGANFIIKLPLEKES